MRSFCLSVDDKICSFALQSYQMTKCKVTVSSSALASSTLTVLKTPEGIFLMKSFVLQAMSKSGSDHLKFAELWCHKSIDFGVEPTYLPTRISSSVFETIPSAQVSNFLALYRRAGPGDREYHLFVSLPDWEEHKVFTFYIRFLKHPASDILLNLK